MNVLQCHSKGNKNFSAFYAKVKVFNKIDSIENHYQLSKRIYNEPLPTSWKDIKGKDVDYFQLDSKLFPKEYLSDFYKLLWIKYFDNNPDLLKLAKKYDDYEDIFKSKKSMVCQADVIRDICKKGRKSVLNECEEFIILMKSKDNLLIIDKSLLESRQNIIGHQVNCQGKMGKGLALQIRTLDNVFSSYFELCNSVNNKGDNLGKCQIVKVDNHRYVANLFGQEYYASFNDITSGIKKKYTEYDKLKNSLIELKEYAIKNKLSVALPHNLGCKLAGGDWNVVSNIIKEVFNDYPIIIHRY